MPLVDLDDPGELRARWAALAAVAHACGRDRIWWSDERGLHYEDSRGNDLRLLPLPDGRAVLFGYHSEESRTAEQSAYADLLSGAPDWIGQPEVRHRMVTGQLGFVFGHFSGTWARAEYPGDPWQPLEDGFSAVGSWLTDDRETEYEIAEQVLEWTGASLNPDEIRFGAMGLIRAAGSGGIGPSHLNDFFALLRGAQARIRPDGTGPDVASGVAAAAAFATATSAAAMTAPPPAAARPPVVVTPPAAQPPPGVQGTPTPASRGDGFPDYRPAEPPPRAEPTAQPPAQPTAQPTAQPSAQPTGPSPGVPSSPAGSPFAREQSTSPFARESNPSPFAPEQAPSPFAEPSGSQRQGGSAGAGSPFAPQNGVAAGRAEEDRYAGLLEETAEFIPSFDDDDDTPAKPQARQPGTAATEGRRADPVASRAEQPSAHPAGLPAMPPAGQAPTLRPDRDAAVSEQAPAPQRPVVEETGEDAPFIEPVARRARRQPQSGAEESPRADQGSRSDRNSRGGEERPAERERGGRFRLLPDAGMGGGVPDASLWALPVPEPDEPPWRRDEDVPGGGPEREAEADAELSVVPEESAGTPAYEAPYEPAYAPTYEAPSEPAYDAQPTYDAPVEPAYDAPAEPAYDTGYEPSYAAPDAPVNGAAAAAAEPDLPADLPTELPAELAAAVRAREERQAAERAELERGQREASRRPAGAFESLEDAMRAEPERPRPRVEPGQAFRDLHEWCRERTKIVPSGFTIHVYVANPQSISYSFDLDPPEVPGARIDPEHIDGLLQALWNEETGPEYGGWMFARIDAAGRTLRVDRWYDSIPSWWEQGRAVESQDVAWHLGVRDPRWQPSYAGRLELVSASGRPGPG